MKTDYKRERHNINGKSGNFSAQIFRTPSPKFSQLPPSYSLSTSFFHLLPNDLIYLVLFPSPLSIISPSPRRSQYLFPSISQTCAIQSLFHLHRAIPGFLGSITLYDSLVLSSLRFYSFSISSTTTSRVSIWEFPATSLQF